MGHLVPRRDRDAVVRPAVRVTGTGLLVGAVLLLLLQLARRKPTVVELQDRNAAVRVDLDRKRLERWLAARLSRVEGVASTDVRVRHQMTTGIRTLPVSYRSSWLPAQLAFRL